MAAHPRENSHVLWPDPDRVRIHQRRSTSGNVSRRIPFGWTRIVRHFNRTVGRQKMKMAEALRNCVGTLSNREKIQEWAAKNAYTLLFLSLMFFITWTLFAIVIWTGYRNGR